MASNRRHRMTVLLSLAAIAGMIGLVAASVPLYRLFCQVTGYGGTTRVAQAAPEERLKRTITVRFDASVARGMPWRFMPRQREMTVRLGEQALAIFAATNTSDQPIVGTATFNVTPDKIGRYFNKIQCFCFTEQRLEPGQSVDMPVTFFIDPALADDPQASEVNTITLSYTFFNQTASKPQAKPRQVKSTEGPP